MSYKRFFLGILGTCLACIVGTLFLAYPIDPIGIWGAPIFCRFNHYKIQQGIYLDVCKPYEYMREKPDILYIGASNMYVGFRPDSSLHPEKKVYSMGLSSLSLHDMREYLRFAYKVHKPEVIYMGLDPNHFTLKAYAEEKRNGFSEERLEHLTGNPLEYYGQAVKDSMNLPNVYFATIHASREHEKDEPLFLRGWDVQRGSADAPDAQTYYYYIRRNLIEFKECRYIPKSLEYLQDIVREAREAKVHLVVFFTPCSVDRYAIMELMGCRAAWDYAKRAAAQTVPIYDFAAVSDLATNRQAYFYDTGHFRVTLGEKLKQCLESRNPSPYGYLLTPKTADDVFAKEDVAWEKWIAENQEYVNALKACIETGHKPEVGEFVKFIGF